MTLTEEDKQWLGSAVLGEFHKVQEFTEIRFRGVEANMRVAQIRLDRLEERVYRLEQK